MPLEVAAKGKTQSRLWQGMIGSLWIVNCNQEETVMVTMQTNYSREMFEVVHPLDDQPEEKRSAEGLGPIPMTPGVKISLMVLRGYLSVMTLMLIYHVLHLSGILGK
jgi:hypothetical protein